MPTCKNCQQTFDGKFCPACGQKENSGSFSFRQFWSHFFNDLFSLESPLFNTFVGLLTRPGKTAAEYIRGRRIRYFRPVRFFLVTMGVFLLVRAVTGFDPLENSAKISGPRPPATEQTIQQMEAGQWLTKNMNIMSFVLVFTLAGISRLLFWRSAFNLAENLVFSFYAVGNYLLLSTIFVFLSFVNPRLFYILYPAIILYLTWSLVTFHHHVSFWGISKAVITSIASYVLYVIIVFQIAYLAVHMWK